MRTNSTYEGRNEDCIPFDPVVKENFKTKREERSPSSENTIQIRQEVGYWSVGTI